VSASISFLFFFFCNKSMSFNKGGVQEEALGTLTREPTTPTQIEVEFEKPWPLGMLARKPEITQW
jgi:hypothetical protein